MCVKPLPVSDRLNFAGQIADDAVRNLSNMFPVIIDKYVVMPNHIHIIIIINEKNDLTISRIINQYKGGITKKIGYPIWQKLFYEHIIRNENEYYKTEANIKNANTIAINSNKDKKDLIKNLIFQLVTI